VSLDHKADLLIFIDEKNCSQTYLQPNIAIISEAAETNFGSFSVERNL